VIFAHLQANENEQLLVYENEARTREVKLTRTSYRHLFAALARTSNTRGVERLEGVMAEDLFKQDMDDFHILFENAPTSSLVTRWYEEITRRKFRLYVETLGIVLRAYARTRDYKSAQEIYLRMTEAQRKAYAAHDALLCVCCDMESHETIVRSILSDANRGGIALQNETYNKLIIFFGKKDSELVQSLATEMQERGYEVSESAAQIIKKAEKGGSLLDTLLGEVDEESESEEKKK